MLRLRNVVREAVGQSGVAEGRGGHRVVLRVVVVGGRWDIDENEFQLAVVEAMITLPNLTSVSLYTSYTVTSTEYFRLTQFPGVADREPQRRGNKGLQEGLDVLISVRNHNLLRCRDVNLCNSPSPRSPPRRRAKKNPPARATPPSTASTKNNPPSVRPSPRRSRQHPPAAQEQRADLQVRQRGQAGGEEGGRQRGVAQFQQAQIPQELPAPQNQLPHQTPEGGRLQLRGRAQRKPHRRRGETQ